MSEKAGLERQMNGLSTDGQRIRDVRLPPLFEPRITLAVIVFPAGLDLSGRIETEE